MSEHREEGLRGRHWGSSRGSPIASYPFLRIQEDLGVEELVTVAVLAVPLGHHLAEVGSITNEAWGFTGVRTQGH